PDMSTTVAGVVSQGYLRATTETPHADNYIVAVPTPFKDGHQPDLSFIETAGKQIAPLLEGNELIILESTSPPGATELDRKSTRLFRSLDMSTTVAGVVSQGYLRATTETPHAYNYIVAVPTPFKDGHQPDLSFIETAGKQIAPLLEGNELIILESTSPPGATEFLAETVMRERPDLTLKPGSAQTEYFAHCPEIAR